MNKFLINLIPGDTFLHKLTGKTKTRLFAVLIVYTVMTFDFRLLTPLLILGFFALCTLKPPWKVLKWIIIFVFFSNVLNMILYWAADPNIGEHYCNSSTVLFAFNSRFIVPKESLWYLCVRMIKMMATFFISLTYVLSVTPSEVAAGLYSMHVPYKVCSIVSLAFRYIPDIARDYQNIKTSMQCRGVELDAKKAGLGVRMKQTILILIPLIISSFDRIGNIANAMDLRGFGKMKKRSYYAEHEDVAGDKIFCVIYCAIGIFCIWYIISGIIWPRATRMWYPF